LADERPVGRRLPEERAVDRDALLHEPRGVPGGGRGDPVPGGLERRSRLGMAAEAVEEPGLEVLERGTQTSGAPSGGAPPSAARAASASPRACWIRARR
jgi:hypothetical protein